MHRETVYLQLISLNLVALTAILPGTVVRVVNVMALLFVTGFHFAWHVHPANRLKVLSLTIASTEDALFECMQDGMFCRVALQHEMLLSTKRDNWDLQYRYQESCRLEWRARSKELVKLSREIGKCITDTKDIHDRIKSAAAEEQRYKYNRQISRYSAECRKPYTVP
ncbi:hypothetical protein VKT23_016501 [Stygiomarasmius scandens]|uniref:Uncharacterized protein n=1 Tax=Marasmiellus scandens TaxID=2682957 RepID=A0ABR1IWP0_9AGAR